MSAGVPSELADAPWLPELQVCCAVAGADDAALSGEQRMGAVLEWLQVMLVELELGGTAELDGEEVDELDNDFVDAARPWLHTKEFFDIKAQGFAQELWEHVSSADYLQPKGEGGAMLLLLPTPLPLSLFEEVTKTVSAGVGAHINPEVAVRGFHPDRTPKEQQSPVPIIQVFLDSPDLLVQGGSMSDAAGFL